MIVQKRDGRLMEFDPDKILLSIKKAALAVEGKDDDIQERARQILNIKNQLIASGFDPEDAEEQAESMFEGYIENGEYTEYDPDEANEVLDIIVESLDNLGQDIIGTDEIQDFTEKALMETGHASTAREYIIHRSNRERVREMNTSLMRSFENLTFGNSKDVETKRENANIDGDSAMGTMLKYGSEGAKKFNLLYLVSPEISRAHSNGDIHIHDLDFMALTETCIAPTTKLIVKYNDSKDYAELNASFLEEYLSEVPLDTWVNISQLKIYSRGTFTNVLRAIKHSAANKRVISIETDFGSLEVTDEHRIPVIRYNREIEIQAREIVIGDKLLIDLPHEKLGRRFEPVSQEVTNITEISYKGNVYDLETENHYYSASGFTVHNCVQIDLEKLFNGGFNTGHGFLREPGEIRSYGALACIAIQSDQNDQHKRVA